MVSRQARLPGKPTFQRRGPWNALDRTVAGVAMLVPTSVLVEAAALTPALVWTGAVATAVTAGFVLVLWSLETRTIAVGTGWLAVGARLSPSWVVVEPGDIASVVPRRVFSAGLAVRLNSGPPVLLRKGEVKAGVLAALADCLGVCVPVASEAVP